MDYLFHFFLSLANSSPPISLDLSFDRLLNSSPSDADQSFLIDPAHKLGCLLLRAVIALLENVLRFINLSLRPSHLISPLRCFRCWIRSLCYTATMCSIFNKFAMDPLCYANIDLTTVVPKRYPQVGSSSRARPRPKPCLNPLGVSAERTERSSGAEKHTNGGLAICISACLDNQAAADTSAFTVGKTNGALAYLLAEVLKILPGPTYGDLFDLIHETLDNINQSGFLVNTRILRRIFNYRLSLGAEVTKESNYETLFLPNFAVKISIITIETDQFHKGIVELVSRQGIRNLVMGAIPEKIT